MSSLSKAFHALKDKNEGALIGYVTAGDPSPKLTPKIADALIKGGADILELGLPFSDPIADGPTIQAASLRALNAGTTPKAVLEIAKQIKLKHNVPVVIMTYYNPVFRTGLQEFLSAAKASFVDGVIIPDLPVEEALEYRNAAKAQSIDTIFLAAPSTSNSRLSKIVEYSSGFLYLVSHFGVTGAKTEVKDSTLSLIKRILPFTAGQIPLAVGFGISKSEHVKSLIAAGADGVIVGSAFVNIIAENVDNPARIYIDVEDMARKLKEATTR